MTELTLESITVWPFFFLFVCCEVPERELILRYFLNGLKGIAAPPNSCGHPSGYCRRRMVLNHSTHSWLRQIFSHTIPLVKPPLTDTSRLWLADFFFFFETVNFFTTLLLTELRTGHTLTRHVKLKIFTKPYLLNCLICESYNILNKNIIWEFVYFIQYEHNRYNRVVYTFVF